MSEQTQAEKDAAVIAEMRAACETIAKAIAEKSYGEEYEEARDWLYENRNSLPFVALRAIDAEQANNQRLQRNMEALGRLNDFLQNDAMLAEIQRNRLLMACEGLPESIDEVRKVISADKSDYTRTIDTLTAERDALRADIKQIIEDCYEAVRASSWADSPRGDYAKIPAWRSVARELENALKKGGNS